MNANVFTCAVYQLAQRGLAVFPLAPGAKVPLAGSHGLKDATSDLYVTRARWSQNPNSNIAIATGSRSRVWVLDVDAHHDGPASLAKIEAEKGPLPVTIEASTPNGGRHLYWRWRAEDPEIRNSASRLGPGLDVRGEGGCIVLPPSVLADGRRYRWVRNGACIFADAPAWLVKLVLPSPPPPRTEPKPPPADVARYIAAAATSELAELERATEGRRNDALNRAAFNIAGFVLAGTLPEDWARRQLEARAIGLGLPTVEAQRTIESAFAAAQPRVLQR